MFSRYFILSLVLLWIGVVHGATINLSVDKTNVTQGEYFTLTVSLDISPNDPPYTFIQAFVLLTGPEPDGTIGDDLTSLPPHSFPIPISLEVGTQIELQQ
jgi:hypothetical protein